MDGAGLVWKIESLGTAIVLRPVGRVDESTSAAFGNCLSQEIQSAAANGNGLVVLSLAGISYMSSRGLRALTLAQRESGERQVRIVLAEPNAIMREILAISRYDLVFSVFETTGAAVSA